MQFLAYYNWSTQCQKCLQKENHLPTDIVIPLLHFLQVRNSDLKHKVILYFLLCNKKSRFDFADEFKVGDVRYKHLTQITIKVQLFWRLAYEM